jgi:WD40 repeat protein
MRATLASPGGSSVNAVAFSPDGKTLATGDQDGSTYRWAVATGHRAATLTVPGSFGVNTVVFDPDGTLATCDYGGEIKLWDQAGHSLPGFGAYGPAVATTLAFSPDGATLAEGQSDGSIYLWDVATGNLTSTLGPAPASGSIQALAFSPDGTLAAGNSNGSTYLWNAASGNQTGTLTDPGPAASRQVRAVAFSQDGETLAVGDSDRGVYLWNVG